MNPVLLIHLNQIHEDGLHLEGEVPSEILDLEDPLYRPTGPIQYSLDLGISGHSFFATGSLSLDFTLECVVCLRDFQRRLRLDEFAMQLDLTGPETVDLTPYVREDILLALPTHPHCDWDGKSVCPGAAAILSKTEQESRGSSVAPSGSAAWDALNKLNIQPDP